MTAPDGSRVTSFGAATVAACPLKVNDYLGQSVTIGGWGRTLEGKAGKPLIQVRKITSITRNAATPEAPANP